MSDEVIEKSGLELCKNCKHPKDEHNLGINIIDVRTTRNDCRHVIIFKNVEYKCTCKKYEKEYGIL